jgi:hypothetical protein
MVFAGAPGYAAYMKEFYGTSHSLVKSKFQAPNFK